MGIAGNLQDSSIPDGALLFNDSLPTILDSPNLSYEPIYGDFASGQGSSTGGTATPTPTPTLTTPPFSPQPTSTTGSNPSPTAKPSGTTPSPTPTISEVPSAIIDLSALLIATTATLVYTKKTIKRRQRELLAKDLS